MPETIVKVQCPLATNDRSKPWLVYDKARTLSCQIPEASLPKGVAASFPRDMGRAFYTAIRAGNVWQLGHRVPDQIW